MWHHIDQFASTLLSGATHRAVTLVSPHIPWGQLTDKGDVEQWAGTASVAPRTEEVVQGVVNALLQIASEDKLVPYIPVDLWSWLTKRPSLPPICLGRYVGTRASVVSAVRALDDIEVLKSYLLLVWSEWDIIWPDGFDEMCTSIQEDFSGVEMGNHRVDLIRRLDSVLGELDRGFEHFSRYSPECKKGYLQKGKRQYAKLKEVLLEVETRKSSPMITHFCILTPVETAASRGTPVPIVSCMEPSV